MLNNSGVSSSSSQQARSSSSQSQQQYIQQQNLANQRQGSADSPYLSESLSQQYSLNMNKIATIPSLQQSLVSNRSGGVSGSQIVDRKIFETNQILNISGTQNMSNLPPSKMKQTSSRSSINSIGYQNEQQQQQQQQLQYQQFEQQMNMQSQNSQEMDRNQMNSPMVSQLKLEIEVLQVKYEDALDRLAMAEKKTNTVSHSDTELLANQYEDVNLAKINYLTKQLQFAQHQLDKEKEKALKVILKLEKDIDSQQKNFDFEKLKLTSQIESINTINEQLQDQINKLKSVENKIVNQEKDDAENVVKELRRQNQLLNDELKTLNNALFNVKQSTDKQEQNSFKIFQEQTERLQSELQLIYNQQEEDKKIITNLKQEVILVEMEKNDLLSVNQNIRNQLTQIQNESEKLSNEINDIQNAEKTKRSKQNSQIDKEKMEYQQKITSLESQILTIKRQTQEEIQNTKQESQNQFTKQIEESQSSIYQLRNMVSESNTTIMKLEAINKQIQLECDILRENNKESDQSQSQRKQIFDKAMNDKDTIIKQLREQISENQQQYSQLSQQFNSKSEIIITLEKENTNLRKQYEERISNSAEDFENLKKQLTIQIQQKNSQVETLQASFMRDMELLKEQYNQKDEEQYQSQQQTQDLRQQLLTLIEEKQEWLAKFEKSHEEQQTQSQSLKDCMRECSSQQETINNLQNIESKLKEEISSLKISNQNLQTQYSQEIGQISTANSRIIELENKCVLFTVENQKIIMSKEEQQQRYNELKIKYEEIEKCYKDLKLQFEMIESERNKLKEKIIQIELLSLEEHSKLIEANAIKDRLQAQIKTEEETLQKLRANLSGLEVLQHQYQEQSQQNEQLFITLQNKETQIQKLTSDIQNYRVEESQKLSLLTSEKENIDYQLKHERESNSKLQSEIINLTNEKTQQINKMTAELEKQHLRLEEEQKKEQTFLIQISQLKIEEQEKQIKITKESDGLQQKLLSLEVEYQHLLTKHADEIQVYEKRLQDANTNSNQFKLSNMQLMDKISELHSEIEQLQSVKKSKNDKIADLSSQNEDLSQIKILYTQKIEELQKQIESVREERDKLTQKLTESTKNIDTLKLQINLQIEEISLQKIQIQEHQRHKNINEDTISQQKTQIQQLKFNFERQISDISTQNEELKKDKLLNEERIEELSSQSMQLEQQNGLRNSQHLQYAEEQRRNEEIRFQQLTTQMQNDKLSYQMKLDQLQTYIEKTEKELDEERNQLISQLEAFKEEKQYLIGQIDEQKVSYENIQMEMQSEIENVKRSESTKLNDIILQNELHLRDITREFEISKKKDQSEIESLNSQIEELNANKHLSVSEMEQQIQDIRISEQTKVSQVIQQMLESKQNEEVQVSNFIKQLEDKSNQIASMQMEIDIMYQRIAEKDKLESQVQELQHINDHFQFKYTQLETAFKQSEQINANQLCTIEQICIESKNFQDLLQQKQAFYSSQESSVTDQIDVLKGNIDKLKIEKSELESSLEQSHQKHIQEKQSASIEVESIRLQLQAQLDVKQSLVAEQKSQIDILKNEITLLQSQVQQVQQNKDSFMKEYEKLQDTNSKLSQTNQELERVLEILNNQMSHSQQATLQEFEGFRQLNDRRVKEFIEKDEKIQELQNQIHQRDIKMLQLSQTDINSERQVENLQLIISNLESEKAALLLQQSKFMERIQQLEGQKSQFRDKYKNIVQQQTSEFLQLKSQVDMLTKRDQNSSFESNRYPSNDVVNKQLKEEVQTQQQELEKAYKLIESKKQECSVINMQFNILKSELEKRIGMNYQSYNIPENADNQELNENKELTKLQNENEILKQKNKTLLQNIVEIEAKTKTNYKITTQSDSVDRYQDTWQSNTSQKQEIVTLTDQNTFLPQITPSSTTSSHRIRSNYITSPQYIPHQTNDYQRNMQYKVVYNVMGNTTQPISDMRIPQQKINFTNNSFSSQKLNPKIYPQLFLSPQKQ